MAFVKEEWGEKDSADYYLYKANKILQAMHFSGDGTLNSPIFALGPHDGQEFIMKHLGARVGHIGSGRDNDKNFIDTLEAKFNDGNSVHYHYYSTCTRRCNSSK